MLTKNTPNLLPDPKNPNPSGLCGCGCGELAPLATATHRDRNEVKGFPRRYVPGHKNGPTRRPVVERFWDHVEKSDNCWLWTGCPSAFGHGKISMGGIGSKEVGAHRLSWEIHCGPIPDGLSVLHTCDVPACVRPDHLFLGRQRDNIADMIAKGRNAYGERSGMAKLTQKDADAIRKLAAMKMKQVTIAALFCVSKCTVSEVVSGKRWGIIH